jgi:hypothetical protein
MADNEINKPELPEGFRKRLETRSLLQPITLPVDPREFQRVWEHIPASQREELIGVLWREGYAFFWNKMKILSRGLQFLSEETRHPDENQVQRADRAANEPEPLVWRSSARSWVTWFSRLSGRDPLRLQVRWTPSNDPRSTISGRTPTRPTNLPNPSNQGVSIKTAGIETITRRSKEGPALNGC